MGWVKGKGHKVQNREEDCHRALFLWPSDFFLTCLIKALSKHR